MFAPIVLSHFQAPHNAGVLPDSPLVARAENPACGDLVEVSLRLSDGAVAEVRFRAQGCVAAIACGSRLTDLVLHLPVSEARALSPEALSAALDGLPEGSLHAARMGIDALRAALRAAPGAG